MEYKISIYNHAIINNDKRYIYNNRTGSIIELESSKYNKLIKFLSEGGKCFTDLEIKKYTDVNNEEINMLAENGFLIDLNLHEELELYKKIEEIKEKKEKIITFVLTEECNFRCIYCFEEHNKRKMNKNLMYDLINYLNSYISEENTEILEITYYGGEPLLEKENLLFLHKKLIENFEDIIDSFTIITNGYLINRNFLEELYNVSNSNEKVRFQITLDGIEEIHDKRRYLCNGEGTFNEIIKNLNLTTKYFDVILRINIDKISLEHLNDLSYELISKIENKEKILISPDFVTANSLSNIEYKGKTIINKSAINEKIIIFKKILKSKGFRVSNSINSPEEYSDFPLNTPKFIYCSALTGNQLVFGTQGDLFACLEHINYPKYSIGNIYDEAIFNEYFLKWKKYNIMNFKECRLCEFNIFCAGGCPSKNFLDKREIFPSCNKEDYISMIDKIIY